MINKQDDILPLLKKVTIFAGLRDEGMRRVIDGSATVFHKNGEVIIREGTPCEEIYIVLEGTVKIVLNHPDNPLEICRFGTGNCLGESSIIGVEAHSATVIAVEDVVLLVLSRKTLMDIFANDKEFFALLILNIAREIARRLHHTDKLLLEFFKKK